jgi:hypothetical protein
MRQMMVFAAVVLVGSLAAAQQGINQTEALIKKGESTLSAIGDAKMQLDKTLLIYNSMIEGRASDMKASYKDLGKAVKDTESRAADVTKRKGEMDVEAEKLFASWKASLNDISSPELKKKSEERLEAAKERQEKIATAGVQARAEYDTFLAGLRDQITFLGHDLNPGAMASLKPDAAKLNARAKAMFEKIGAVTATASASLDAMKAQ